MPAGEGVEGSQGLISVSSEEPNILSLQPRTPKQMEAEGKRERKQKTVEEK